LAISSSASVVSRFPGRMGWTAGLVCCARCVGWG
jgi:hypothetical protein